MSRNLKIPKILKNSINSTKFQKNPKKYKHSGNSKKFYQFHINPKILKKSKTQNISKIPKTRYKKSQTVPKKIGPIEKILRLRLVVSFKVSNINKLFCKKKQKKDIT